MFNSAYEVVNYISIIEEEKSKNKFKIKFGGAFIFANSNENLLIQNVYFLENKARVTYVELKSIYYQFLN